MASIIVTTPGASTANSYVSASSADAFFATAAHPNSAEWLNENGAARSDASKDALLIQATQAVDQYHAYLGLVKFIDGYATPQALVYPFGGWSFTAVPSRAAFMMLSPSSGTTITAVCSGLSFFADDRFNGGAVWVAQSNDRAAPEYEVRAVTDFVRSTYTLTTAAFSAAIESGDQLALIFPVPTWLQRATCLQALYMTRKEGGARDDWNKGVANKSDPTGQSLSYRDTGRTGHLGADVAEIINANVARSLRSAR